MMITKIILAKRLKRFYFLFFINYYVTDIKTEFCAEFETLSSVSTLIRMVRY